MLYQGNASYAPLVRYVHPDHLNPPRPVIDHRSQTLGVAGDR